MKKLYLLWLLLGMSFIAYSQVITVKDQETGEPLEFVAINSGDFSKFVTTNNKGQADISTFQKVDTMVIRSLGYQTIHTSFAEIKANAFVQFMSPSSILMDEIVVSANRRQQILSDVPSKISSITAAEIALQNPQTAADLLNISGNVFIQKSQQGGGSPMIRGFATNRLLYTVDGVRMNTAIFRSGNIQNVISLDPFAIEKAEVSFGPGSIIYGSDAIGGVMSFQTLTPHFSLAENPLISGKAIARYASANNEKTGHFDVKVGWKKWALVTSFSSNDFGDLKMGSHGPDEYLRPVYVQAQNGTDVVLTNVDPKVQTPSGYAQINMMQKVRFKPNEDWDFQYGFHYSETSDYARYDRHLRYRNGLPRYGEWSYGPQKWMMNNLNVTHKGHHVLYDLLTIQLAQQFFEESRIDRNLNQPERHIRIEEVNAYSGNLDFTKNIGRSTLIYYGFEIVQNDVSSTGKDEDIAKNTVASGPARYPQSTWSSYAAYLSGQFRLTDKLMLQTGLRYNQFRLDATFDNTFYPFPFTTAKLNNGALTGSLGFTYRSPEDWLFSANVSTAFRSPNVDDVGKIFDSEPGAVVVPNPDLKAEYAYNAEVGIAKLVHDAIKLELSAYYTVLQNALVRRDFSLNGQDSILYDGTLSQVQAIQNAAIAHVYGLQAGIEIKLPSGFEFSTNFNYQKGEEELDEGIMSPSRHAAPWFGVTRLGYRAKQLQFQFSAVYSGEKQFEDLPESEKGKTEIYAIDENGNPWSPAWYTLNFKAMYRFTDHLSISAGLENLTDQRYRPFSSGLVAPGRNFMLAFRADF